MNLRDRTKKWLAWAAFSPVAAWGPSLELEFERVRAEALEEAAETCDNHTSGASKLSGFDSGCEAGAEACAADIRSLGSATGRKEE